MCFVAQDSELQIPEVSVQVYERAVRNCPWSSELWANYLRAAERKGDPPAAVKGQIIIPVYVCVCVRARFG